MVGGAAAGATTVLPTTATATAGSAGCAAGMDGQTAAIPVNHHFDPVRMVQVGRHFKKPFPKPFKNILNSSF